MVLFSLVAIHSDIRLRENEEVVKMQSYQLQRISLFALDDEYIYSHGIGTSSISSAQDPKARKYIRFSIGPLHTHKKGHCSAYMNLA